MTYLIQGNAFDIPLEDKSVHCVVTSPPYYSLRKYQGEQEFIFGGDKDCEHEWEEHSRKGYSKGQGFENLKKWNGSDIPPKEIEHITAVKTNFCHKCNAWRGAYGLEPTLQMYIDHTVEWCREVWRVLRDDGTFWLNMGDSYAGSGGPGNQRDNKSAKGQFEKFSNPNRDTDTHGLKPKDLMGVPWRVALALQADGWWLRSDVIEKVELYCPCGCGFVLEEKIWRYSQDREIIWEKKNPMPESVTDRPTKSHEYVFLLTKSKNYYYDADAIREPNTLESKQRAMRGNSEDNKYAAGEHMPPGIHANTMSQPREFKGYDDMEDTIERGETPLNPSGRNKRTVWTIATAPYKGAHFATYPPALVEPCIKAGCPENGIVLDPFSGSGTTIMVARKLGRTGIGLDLSAEYIELAKERLSIKALEEWEQGKPGETEYEGLPMFDELK